MYGLHNQEGINYLVQRTTQNAVGLNKSPTFPVDKRATCPHNIMLDKPQSLIPKVDDPLISALSPIPKTKPSSYFITSSPEVNEIIFYARNMIDPTIQTVIPASGLTQAKAQSDFNNSNIVTYIITDIEKPAQMIELAQLAYFAPAKVIFTGSPTFPIPMEAAVERIQTTLVLSDVMKSATEWKRYGADLIREYMRECL